jgi:hypothetical protein
LKPYIFWGFLFVWVASSYSKADLFDDVTHFKQSAALFAETRDIVDATSFAADAYKVSSTLEDMGWEPLASKYLVFQRVLITNGLNDNITGLDDIFFVNIIREVDLDTRELLLYTADKLVKDTALLEQKLLTLDKEKDKESISLLRRHCELTLRKLTSSEDVLINERCLLSKEILKKGARSTLRNELLTANTKELGLLYRTRGYISSGENPFLPGAHPPSFSNDSLRDFQSAFNTLNVKCLANDGEVLACLAELSLLLNTPSDARLFLDQCLNVKNKNYFQGQFNASLVTSFWCRLNSDLNNASAVLDSAQILIDSIKQPLFEAYSADDSSITKDALKTWLQFRLSRERLRLASSQNSLSKADSDIIHIENFIYTFLLTITNGSSNDEYLALRNIIKDAVYDVAFLTNDNKRLSRDSCFTKGLLRSFFKAKQQNLNISRFTAPDLKKIRETSPHAFASFDAIISWLGRKEAFIDIIRCESSPDSNGFSHPIYVALIYQRQHDQQIDKVVLGEAKVIDRAIRSFNASVRLTGDDQALEEAAKSLHSYLVKPLLPFFGKDIESIVFCPDSLTHYVSFGCLPDSNNKFLAERYNIIYATDARSLLKQRTQEVGPTANLKGYIFSDPENNSLFDNAYLGYIPTTRSIFSFNRLPFSALEGDVAESYWNYFFKKESRAKVIRLNGYRASKKNFLAMDNPYFIHIACHGFYSFLVDRASKETTHGGLLMASSQQIGSDSCKVSMTERDFSYIVSTADIEKINLNNCFLAIVSACESGLGTPYDGEGLVGLRSSFQNAGVANQLLCLWPVDDKESYLFMKALYEQFKETGIHYTSFSSTMKDALRLNNDKYGVAKSIRNVGPFVWIGENVPFTNNGIPWSW